MDLNVHIVLDLDWSGLLILFENSIVFENGKIGVMGGLTGIFFKIGLFQQRNLLPLGVIGHCLFR